MQYSELLETKPSVVYSLFPLYNKSSAHVCTLDRDRASIISFHCRAAESPLPSISIHKEAQRTMATATMNHMDQHNYSLAYGTSKYQQKWHFNRPALNTPPLITGLLMVFLTTPYSRDRRESWKELTNSLPLVLLISNPSQNPSLARVTQLGLSILAAPL